MTTSEPPQLSKSMEYLTDLGWRFKCSQYIRFRQGTPLSWHQTSASPSGFNSKHQKPEPHPNTWALQEAKGGEPGHREAHHPFHSAASTLHLPHSCTTAEDKSTSLLVSIMSRVNYIINTSKSSAGRLSILCILSENNLQMLQRDLIPVKGLSLESCHQALLSTASSQTHSPPKMVFKTPILSHLVSGHV